MIVGISLINRGYFPESVNATVSANISTKSYICKFFCLSRSTITMITVSGCAIGKSLAGCIIDTRGARRILVSSMAALESIMYQ